MKFISTIVATAAVILGSNALPIAKRAGKCAFPFSGGSDHVVAITPHAANNGWAMSPQEACTPGSWCPYACEPGYYSAQWDPNAHSANGSGSKNGGLFCEENGELSKPFPDRPYCLPGLGNAHIENKLSQSVSACQTVYPGNEAMVIPTVAHAGGTASINVVPNTYWLGTSAQYYVNLAGSDASQCIWGNSDKPVGNWGPYIFGAGQGKDGGSYISVQYNPLYKQSGFDTKDAYNVRIECVSGNCNFPSGNECKCENGSCSASDGCTVNLPDSARAKFVLY